MTAFLFIGSKSGSIKDIATESVFFLWAFAVDLEPQQKPREKDTFYWKVFRLNPSSIYSGFPIQLVYRPHFGV